MDPGQTLSIDHPTLALGRKSAHADVDSKVGFITHINTRLICNNDACTLCSLLQDDINTSLYINALIEKYTYKYSLLPHVNVFSLLGCKNPI
jgi:hypothetical protein